MASPDRKINPNLSALQAIRSDRFSESGKRFGFIPLPTPEEWRQRVQSEELQAMFEGRKPRIKMPVQQYLPVK